MNQRLFATLALLLTVTCAALWLPTRHAARAQETAQLTAMDYIEIQQLVNQLSFALDYCTGGGQSFADLFIDGGTFIIDMGNGTPTRMNTREQLIALAGGPDCESRNTPPTSYILHLSEGLVIETSPDGARGKSYAIYPANRGKYFQDDFAGQAGIYFDEYVNSRDGWRFKSRTHQVSPVIGAIDW